MRLNVYALQTYESHLLIEKKKSIYNVNK